MIERPNRLVKVYFLDSAGKDGWVGEYKTPDLTCVMTGFVLEHTEDNINLCMGYTNDGEELLCPQTIPMCAVIKMEEL